MKSNVFSLCFVSTLILAACGNEADQEAQTGSDDNREDTEVVGEEESNGVAEDEEAVADEEEQTERDVATNGDEEGTEEKSDDLGDFEVFLGGEMTEAEDSIIVEGESNLLPGSRIDGVVSTGEEDDEDAFYADTTELVEDDGSFHLEIEHHDFDEETYLEVMFHFDGAQDDEMIRHYGDRGQELEGPYIYQHEGETGGGSPDNIYQKAMVRTSFEPIEEQSVRQLQEPEWYDLPDDYGDPSVWIEVDEINDDQEHYYLHGRSNLLEGSDISGSFGSNSDETNILPDGSFDLEIPYEYLEDESFVIEFDPTSWQWNSVEEVYGQEGQNLVGDLVVTNDYNNNQRIEKEVDHESTEIDVPDNVELDIEGSDMTMLVPDDLLFNFDEYEIKEDAQEILDDIGETLEQFDRESAEIHINGHTDNVGDTDYNLGLSEDRAEEVEAYLLEEGDFRDIELITEGYGETQPVASNDDEDGQEKNRRVEIVIELQ